MKKIIILFMIILISIFIFSSKIELKIAEFEPLVNMPDFDKLNLQKNTMQLENEFFLVQFTDKTQNQWKRQIEQIGAQIYDYIPQNAFIVKMNKEQFDIVSQFPFVKFIQLYQPAYRISPDLIYNKQTLMKNEQQISLTIVLFDKEYSNSVLDKLKNIGINRVEYMNKYIRVYADEYNMRDLSIQIANMPEVYWIERDYPNVLHNAWSRWISDSFDTLSMKAILGGWNAQLRLTDAADSVTLTAYSNGIFGDGQIIGVDDTGLDWDNIYFRDPTQSIYYDKDKDSICENPNYNHRKIVAYNAYVDTFDLNSSGHGTHTSGSVAGDSLGTNFPGDSIIPRANGMAFNAKLAFVDLGDNNDGLWVPFDYNLIYTWAYNAGARITSSSWGAGSGGSSSYTSYARQLDEISWNHKDLLMLRSAGNDNNDNPPDSVNTPATAKNIVTVGSSESGFGYGSTSWSVTGSGIGDELDDVSSFSSHGPTLEGQMKPELLAPGGHYIWSADSDGDLSTDNYGITYMGGTSMSCPTAAGFAALIRQYFTDGYYPSGSANVTDAFNPSAALIKAMLINSTKNSPGAYSTDAINNVGSKNAPSMGQGWGRIAIADVLYFPSDTRDLLVYDETTGFSSTGEYAEYSFVTGPSTEEYIKIVLVWTDYPAAVAPSTVVVNDLNLTVIANGEIYKGNVFGTNARSTTGGVYDDKNVNEVVWLDPMPNTNISIRVDANAINNGPQPYALVITGDINNSANQPGIKYNGSTVYDTLAIGTIVYDSTFNNGETADLYIEVKNSLDSTITNISGVLYTNSVYVIDYDSSLTFPDLDSNAVGGDISRISIASNTPDGMLIPFTLITYYNSTQDTSYFSVSVNGTSIVNLDRDSLVINYALKSKNKINKSDNINMPIEDIITIKSKEAESTILLPKIDESIKSNTYDTLMYDDGTVTYNWYGANYWAVKFNVSRSCSLKAIWWGRNVNTTQTDTLFVYTDNGTSPGTLLYSRTSNVLGSGTNIYNRLTIDGPELSAGDFWVVIYAFTDSLHFFNGDGSGGTYSYYYDGANWVNLAGSGLSSDLFIRAEVQYNVSIVDSAMFYVINNDTASVKSISIDTIIVKNNSSWIAMISPLNGLIDTNDSLGIMVYIDSTGLLPDTTYIDTLLIYTNADFSKNIILNLPVILRTTSSNIEKEKIINNTIISPYFNVSTITSGKIKIDFAIKDRENVNISIYDLTGRCIKVYNSIEDAGKYSMNWNLNISNGIYFVKAKIGNREYNRKVIIVK